MELINQLLKRPVITHVADMRMATVLVDGQRVTTPIWTETNQRPLGPLRIHMLLVALVDDIGHDLGALAICLLAICHN